MDRPPFQICTHGNGIHFVETAKLHMQESIDSKVVMEDKNISSPHLTLKPDAKIHSRNNIKMQITAYTHISTKETKIKAECYYQVRSRQNSTIILLTNIRLSSSNNMTMF